MKAITVLEKRLKTLLDTLTDSEKDLVATESVNELNTPENVRRARQLKARVELLKVCRTEIMLSRVIKEKIEVHHKK